MPSNLLKRSHLLWAGQSGKWHGSPSYRRLTYLRTNLDLSVVVILGHHPKSLYDLPGKIRPIWTGCERNPDSDHAGTSSPDEPNHHWRYDIDRYVLRKETCKSKTQLEV